MRRSFSRVAVVNRGEAALRFIHAARELNREGQVFFVHKRVHDIQALATKLQSLIPEATFAVAHGQMPENQLEQVMGFPTDQPGQTELFEAAKALNRETINFMFFKMFS